MLKLLNTEQFDLFFDILKNSFPLAEYRPYDKQKLLLEQPNYKIYVHEDSKVNAIFATWEGPNFIFLEHFAVAPLSRNNGLGSQLLKEFISIQTKPVILEVEKPMNDLQRRRIQFYERNGFQLSPFGYYQPILTPGEEIVSLVWMTYPRKIENTEAILIRDWIFKEVYYLD